jgi:hypothetical protein
MGPSPSSVNANHLIAPAALPFTVARAAPKWHTSTSEYRGLHFDAPLVAGKKKTAVAQRPLRCTQ